MLLSGAECFFPFHADRAEVVPEFAQNFLRGAGCRSGGGKWIAGWERSF